tara:strand:- start:1447 stop:2760 length:1314 start_codon:yes stop_codon:yes gene_type:complete
MTYFAGNVLPPTNSQTSLDDEDPTFRFTRDEAKKLVPSLIGKPIRCEHSKTLECGRITKAMIDKTGKVYIIGKINDTVDKNGKKNVINTFADKALGVNGKRGYYPSLSLQHVHEESVDGKITQKRALEVSLVHKPRRANCDIIGIARPKNAIHAASSKKATSEIQEYIGDTGGTNTEDISDLDSSAMSAADTNIAAESKPAETTPVVAETTVEKGKVGQSSATPETGKQEADGDFKMGDVVNVVLQQETELDKLREQLAQVEKERDEHKTVNEARKKQELEAAAAKKAADLEKAEALLSTLTSLWDEQVPDAVWTENKDDNVKKMQEFAKKEPELAKQLFSVVHSASSRYQTVLSQESQYKHELSSKLGSVMKKRKVVHAASARAAESAPETVAEPKKDDPKDLMAIMQSYGGINGTAHNLMTRLYNQQMERRRTPF